MNISLVVVKKCIGNTYVNLYYITIRIMNNYWTIHILYKALMHQTRRYRSDFFATVQCARQRVQWA